MGRRKYRGQDGVIHTRIDTTKDKTLDMDEQTLYVDGLVPNTVYTFNISAKFMDGNRGPPYSIQVLTNAEG